MNNKSIIENKLKGKYTIGCYDEGIERLSLYELQNVVERMFEEATDVDVKIKKRYYIVEINTVDDEKDFSLLTTAEYKSRYGDERFED